VCSSEYVTIPKAFLHRTAGDDASRATDGRKKWYLMSLLEIHYLSHCKNAIQVYCCNNEITRTHWRALMLFIMILRTEHHKRTLISHLQNRWDELRYVTSLVSSQVVMASMKMVVFTNVSEIVAVSFIRTRLYDAASHRTAIIKLFPSFRTYFEINKIFNYTTPIHLQLLELTYLTVRARNSITAQ
jgi:hypothetical protein